MGFQRLIFNIIFRIKIGCTISLAVTFFCYQICSPFGGEKHTSTQVHAILEKNSNVETNCSSRKKFKKKESESLIWYVSRSRFISHLFRLEAAMIRLGTIKKTFKHQTKEIYFDSFRIKKMKTRYTKLNVYKSGRKSSKI